MRYLVWGLTLLIVLVGCKSVKTDVTEVKVESEKKISVLSLQNKRKFDYFFYEGQRLKMNGDLNKAKNYFVECLKIDSLSATCYYELANIAITAKNYKAAQDLLSNSVRLSPNNKWYQILLGDLYQQNKDLKSAIKVYEGLALKFSDNDEFNYILAQLYYNDKQYGEAIEAYNRLEKSIGIHEVISVEKEKLYLEMGKQSLAYKEIQKLIDDNPYETRYYGFMGDFHLINKDFKKAENSYSKILELDEDNGLGFFSIANVKLLQKDTISFFENFVSGLNDKDLALEVKFQKLLPLLMGKEFNTYRDKDKIENLFSVITEVHDEDARSYILLRQLFTKQ